MKRILTREDVMQAIKSLTDMGKKPTLACIHAALDNRGSMSTVVRLKAEIDGIPHATIDSAESLKAFREVWAAAANEGRNQREDVLDELRENQKALATENERLEGKIVAAHNRANELDRAKTQAEMETKQVRSDSDHERKEGKSALEAARDQAAATLVELAEARAVHALQISALQADLAAAIHRSHDFELQLTRALAIIETRGIQLTPPGFPKSA